MLEKQEFSRKSSGASKISLIEKENLLLQLYDINDIILTCNNYSKRESVLHVCYRDRLRSDMLNIFKTLLAIIFFT